VKTNRFDPFSIGAIVRRKLGTKRSEKKHKKGGRKKLTFKNPKLHREFVDCLFDAVKD